MIFSWYGHILFGRCEIIEEIIWLSYYAKSILDVFIARERERERERHISNDEHG